MTLEAPEVDARRHALAVVYVNQVGGNDDLVFDGRSLAFDAEGRLVAQGSYAIRSISALLYSLLAWARISCGLVGILKPP